MKKRINWVILSVFFSINSYSQTIGIGEVVSMESKVLSIENNKTKINQLQLELPLLEKLWKEKLQRLRDELAVLYKDRDNLIADMKIGARCSKCGEWKSEFEKKGQSFEKHLGDVQGYAIPATTSELEITRKSFGEQIAIKKVQIQNLEKGDKTIIKKKNEIDDLEKANGRLCQEITQHSKNYETILFKDAKDKHQVWSDNLMSNAINILISDDKVMIFKARVPRYEREYQTESTKIKDQIKNENDAAQQSKGNTIALNEQKIIQIVAEKENSVTVLKEKLQELLLLKNEIDPNTVNDLSKEKLSGIIQQINDIENSITKLEQETENKIATLKNDNKKLSDDIFQLKNNLTKQQEEAVQPLKSNYNAKKAEAKQLEISSITELAYMKKTFTDKSAEYQKKNDSYVNEIATECNRMLLASQKVSCPIYNIIKGMVVSNWNEVSNCVKAIAVLSKPYSTHVFNSYCKGTTSSNYMSVYKSFIAGLRIEDKEIVKANSNADWFELMNK